MAGRYSGAVKQWLAFAPTPKPPASGRCRAVAVMCGGGGVAVARRLAHSRCHAVAAMCGGSAAAVATAAFLPVAVAPSPAAVCDASDTVVDSTPHPDDDDEAFYLEQFSHIEPEELNRWILGTQMQKKESLLARPAEYGHTTVVKILLDAGADPLMEDEKGRTPLHIAAWKGHAKVVELLVQRNPSTVDMHDRKYRGSALNLAAMHGKVEAVRVLLAAGADRDFVLNPPPESRHSAVGGDYQSKVPISELHGMNSLHLACMRGHAAVVQELLRAGMEPDALSGRLQTPMGLATDGGHAEVVGVLNGQPLASASSLWPTTGSGRALAGAAAVAAACVVVVVFRPGCPVKPA